MNYSKRRGTPCIDCGATLRTKHDKVADYPGTRVHASSGLCTMCYNTRRELGQPITHELPPKPLVVHGHDSDDHRERTNAATTQAWLNARRSKGIPVEGVPA